MSTQQENTTPRTKLSTIIVPTNLFGDPDLCALIALHGPAAAAVWYPMLCAIASKGGAKLTNLRLQGAIVGVSPDVCDKVIASALELELLRTDGDLIVSDQVDIDAENVRAKQQKWREKKQRQRGCPPTVPTCPPNVPGDREGTYGGVPPMSEEEYEHEYEDLESKINLENKDQPTTRAPAKEEPPPEAPADPLLADAEKRLEPPNGQPWTSTNQWIGAGRRPMRKFPLIFLTPHELVQALQQIRKSIPPDDVAGVFESCEARLRNKSPQQRDSTSAYNWLTGWCLEEAIDKATKRQRGKNSGVPVAPIVRTPPQQSAGPPLLAESEPRVSDEKAKEFIQKLKEATRCAKSIQ